MANNVILIKLHQIVSLMWLFFDEHLVVVVVVVVGGSSLAKR